MDSCCSPSFFPDNPDQSIPVRVLSSELSTRRANPFMSSGTPDAILRRLLLVAEQKSADQSDLHLLECFVSKKDEAAFAALMERHARLVFGVCRSVLEQEQ